MEFSLLWRLETVYVVMFVYEIIVLLFLFFYLGWEGWEREFQYQNRGKRSKLFVQSGYTSAHRTWHWGRSSWLCEYPLKNNSPIPCCLDNWWYVSSVCFWVFNSCYSSVYQPPQNVHHNAPQSRTLVRFKVPLLTLHLFLSFASTWPCRVVIF